MYTRLGLSVHSATLFCNEPGHPSSLCLVRLALMQSRLCCDAWRLEACDQSALALGALGLRWRLCFTVLLCARPLISVSATPLLTPPPTCTAALLCRHAT